MTAGLYLIVVGLTIVTAPFWEMHRRFGELDENTIWKLLAEMPFKAWINLSVAMRVGLAMLAFGAFMIVRPR